MCALNGEPPILPISAAELSSFREAAQRALQTLMAAQPDCICLPDAELWLERTVAVLTRNAASGRFASARRFQQHASLSLAAYAQQILTLLAAEWERIEELRTGDTLHWRAVLQRLERRAYYWLRSAGREVWAYGDASDVAAKTCEDLWQSLKCNSFPFDVPFDHWSERALLNRLREFDRKRRQHARHVVASLDHPCYEDGSTLGDLLPSADMRTWLDLESNREVLLQACAHLDERQARIVSLWYLEGWSAEEIAAEIGLQVNHVYVLRHRAIKTLRMHYTDL